MDVQIEPSWKQHLAPEFEKPYFVKLTNFVRQEYRTTTCYPPGKSDEIDHNNPRFFYCIIFAWGIGQN